MRRDYWYYYTPVQVLTRHLSELLLGTYSGVLFIIIKGESTSSYSLKQHPENKDVCSYDVFLRTLGGTADTSSTPAVVPAAQASNNANRDECTFTETQEFCTNSSIAREHTTTVTPQRKRVWTECCDPKGVHTNRCKQHA